MAHTFMPRSLYSIDRVLASLTAEQLRTAEARAEYYCRRGINDADTVAANFMLPKSKPRHTGYFFPLRHLLNYFPQEVRLRYFFGDVYESFESPTLTKARLIGDDNGILLPLNAIRHFRFVDRDPMTWEQKRPQMVSRNEVHRSPRIEFMEQWFGHPLADMGQVNAVGGRPDLWLRPRMTIEEQLKYKFIACIEGNDVATNLKWVMSSNSLPVMSPPSKETWFMEATLQPGVNYVALRPDFSDLPEQLGHFLSHPAEAEAMLRANHAYIAQFANPRVELATALLTLRKAIL